MLSGLLDFKTALQPSQQQKIQAYYAILTVLQFKLADLLIKWKIGQLVFTNKRE